MSDENIVNDEPQLYAGKFKSIEDLEKGYKEGLSVHLRNKELETEINTMRTLPDSYQVPEGIQLRESHINDIKDLAKCSGMNQNQFDSALKNYNDKVASQLSDIETRRNQVGEEKINVIKGYVDNKFSEFDDSFRQEVINKCIRDDNMMEKVMSDRDNMLNSKAPGVNQVPVQVQRRNDMKSELFDAGIKAKMDPRNKSAREKYINLCRDVAHAKSDM